jgi:hypothetical protein
MPIKIVIQSIKSVFSFYYPLFNAVRLNYCSSIAPANYNKEVVFTLEFFEKYCIEIPME